MALIATVPSVVFKTRVRDESIGRPNPFRWQDRTTEELFAGKRVVVFSLPGAFTPTCYTSHMPPYEELYKEFQPLGVDSVICISVMLLLCTNGVNNKALRTSFYYLMGMANLLVKWEC